MLRQLLRSHLQFEQVRNETFQSGFTAEGQVVPSARFILFQEGTVAYEVEGGEVLCEAGTAIFVPAWIRRNWKVVSAEPVRLLWAVFSVSERAFNTQQALIIDYSPEFASLVSGMERILTLWSEPDFNELLGEGELKALLARFLSHVKSSIDVKSDGDRHAEVDFAVRWLQAHYDVSSALGGCNSPNAEETS